MSNIKKVLIANRSEVACRIQATCHARGIQTIAVFESNDAYLAYVARATYAYRLSGSGFSAYQAQDEIIEIALRAGADAVHPGYGFLAENASFAKKVINAGMIWIGPAPEVISCMGDKHLARQLAQESGVPVVPAFHLDHVNPDDCYDAFAAAQQIGFPIILKDPFGGGGKGMRRVDCAQDFAASWQRVCSEASKLTGGRQILVEKYLTQARHIEIQIAGSGASWIHLYERECSIQRRHQKIIEEAPCAFVTQETLDKMYCVALQLAKKVNYTSVGTIEFIVTPDEQFYFLEMNTRLQVEHSITELTTGVDLVSLQLDVAQAGKLPLTQADIIRRGHAIECRIYAENPEQNFMPATGMLHHVAIPTIPFGRIDHDLYKGLTVTPFFDPMIAKVSTYGATRQQAAAFMHQALSEFILNGVITNINFLKNILQDELFTTGAFHTQLLADKNLVQSLAEYGDRSGQIIPQEHIALIAAMLSQPQPKKNNTQMSAQVVRQQDGWKDRQWE